MWLNEWVLSANMGEQNTVIPNSFQNISIIETQPSYSCTVIKYFLFIKLIGFYCLLKSSV